LEESLRAIYASVVATPAEGSACDAQGIAQSVSTTVKELYSERAVVEEEGRQRALRIDALEAALTACEAAVAGSPAAGGCDPSAALDSVVAANRRKEERIATLETALRAIHAVFSDATAPDAPAIAEAVADAVAALRSRVSDLNIALSAVWARAIGDSSAPGDPSAAASALISRFEEGSARISVLEQIIRSLYCSTLEKESADGVELGAAGESIAAGVTALRARLGEVEAESARRIAALRSIHALFADDGSTADCDAVAESVSTAVASLRLRLQAADSESR
jgi:hypothetical protein